MATVEQIAGLEVTRHESGVVVIQLSRAARRRNVRLRTTSPANKL